MPNPTVHDVAKMAGVSLATVDRVLNGRAGVRKETIRKVQEAIEDMGYIRDMAAANLAKGYRYRLAFILPSIDTSFMTALRDEAKAAVPQALREKTDIELISVPVFDGQALAKTLDGLAPDVSGVALVATEDAHVHHAIGRLKARGVRVVTLVSDLPGSGRDHFVGIDNVAAGRTSAALLGRFIREKTGKVLVVLGSSVARDHLERRMGFDRVMRQEFPTLEILPSLEGHDDFLKVEDVVGSALDRLRNVVGIYSVGAGTRGLLNAVHIRGKASSTTIVAHELSPVTRAGLMEGSIDAVISQNAGREIRSAIRVLRGLIDDVELNVPQEQIGVDIFLRENLPN